MMRAKLSVKHGIEQLQIEFALERPVAELQALLEEKTGLMVRKQKLMAAGKVISGRPGSLADAGVKPNAKLMLLAAAGAASAGQAALQASRVGRQDALERGRAALAERAEQKGIAVGGAASSGATAVAAASMQQRAATWQKTGIAALRDLRLAQLPPELFNVASGVRVLDAGGNQLAVLPPAFTVLSALQRLRLSINQLSDEGMGWQLLGALPQLSVLSADDNRLTALPPAVATLARLSKLSLNGNQIASLPDSIAALTQLRALALRGNRLAALPAGLGGCSALVECDLRDNQIADLPAELSQLTNLRLLLLDNNRLKAVPPALLSSCSSLATLSLHSNPITAEQLRETEGYAAFDERRRKKYDKQVDMRVLRALVAPLKTAAGDAKAQLKLTLAPSARAIPAVHRQAPSTSSHVWSPSSPGKPVARRRGSVRWTPALVAALLAGYMLWRAHSSGPQAQQAAAGGGGKAAGAAVTGEGAATAPPQQCAPIQSFFPWGAHCQRLQHVCVDSGQLIFYDEMFQSGSGRDPARLPTLKIDRTRLHRFPWRRRPGGGAAEDDAAAEQDEAAAEQPGGEHFDRRRLPPLPARPASSQEPRPYLVDPHFSHCTVPVVIYPLFAENFAHVFHDLASYLHALLRRTPWRQRAKLVAVTPDGLALSPPLASLLPALSNLSVQSWADFSRRLPPDYNAATDTQHPPPSFEGGEQRCFASLLVCGRRFRPAKPLQWGLPQGAEAEPDALRHAVPRENYGFGQEVVQYVQRQSGSSSSSGSGSGSKSASNSGSRFLGIGGGGGSGRQPLRVRFMQRDSGGRQLLNIAELVAACNAWRFTPPGGGPPLTADCRQVALPSLEAGVSAAQDADLFVGMHGANMANSYLMPPGSSTLEVTPFEFGKMKGTFGPSIQNAQDASSQLLWWSAVVCDPSLSEPGPKEVAGQEPARYWPRDRSVRVPWPVVRAVLEEAVALRGDRQRYLDEFYLPGRHRFYFTADGVVGHGDQPLCAGA
ncbi:LRR repeats and ubiquitin-like domain-containing protein isoform A [Micractinium conductrix]|uniref:LRR repeats and ubiquitin-like domain-containing protein isoform A n=1 Tax=Micractinium conductrix TaxID=554055 RepID=A0A2P6VNL3_9CHLO|nr:LRR repeats and ubiquitin-like domain-containing protein isoform A [Micractinium conductrix]|eukprot:PSC75686.1 LRR repeats and ubiquitin-like domain-containing protein isoform A [Micractinium conductrix]